LDRRGANGVEPYRSARPSGKRQRPPHSA
jgi:hypothetical protein